MCTSDCGNPSWAKEGPLAVAEPILEACQHVAAVGTAAAESSEETACNKDGTRNWGQLGGSGTLSQLRRSAGSCVVQPGVDGQKTEHVVEVVP